ncbi:amino acid ABC transporter permease [Jiella sp. MQZ9-1]|uniref:Amino acid ABC transporter permease n=1 Tax=Jiella flava TaxID=2816857 RepID=A0A939FXT6_9HYPH|nr:amino acid ABC transporter permease [Jiella flava]MBO0663968.1 amino acid ABC transporter permease [Jiella flava]MCD2472539.1 amino acid ABC transporter permease [Jiella flava]
MIDTLSFWREWLPLLLEGLKVSVEVAFASIPIGIFLGLVFALGIQSKSKPLQALTVFVVELGRGTPVLILLQFAYFGLPSAGLALSSYAAAVAALAASTGAYTSEIIRAGLEAVPYGQKEAAIAIGLSRRDQLRDIILPQGLRIAVPPLLGFSILVFQGTSLGFAIALPELISRAYFVGSNTFHYMPIFVLAGLLFAAICVPATLLVSRLEKRLSRYTAS